MYPPDSLTEQSTFTSGGYPQAHVETHVSLATGVTTDTDVDPESDAILLEFISPAILAGALGWVKRNPICGERKILKARSTTFVETRVQVSLTIWVDTLSAPVQGEMSIAMREEKSTGEKRFPDGIKILDIPVSCWTAPDEKAFHKRLDLIFAADGELMHDDVLWGGRKAYIKSNLRPTVMTVCRQVYDWYEADFAAATKAGMSSIKESRSDTIGGSSPQAHSP
ncbi:hypothetical protein NCC49_004633 [Naganishia albida]|nr:hypothetical protein NCC49_004633 [Naganishia albida]